MDFTLKLTNLREVGQDEDGIPSWSKLLGCLEINGVPHHFEAWAVQYTKVEAKLDEHETDTFEQQEPVSPFTNYNEVVRAMEISGGQTVEINGHDYFICVTPYED